MSSHMLQWLPLCYHPACVTDCRHTLALRVCFAVLVPAMLFCALLHPTRVPCQAAEGVSKKRRAQAVSGRYFDADSSASSSEESDDDEQQQQQLEQASAKRPRKAAQAKAGGQGDGEAPDSDSGPGEQLWRRSDGLNRSFSLGEFVPLE
jgi:hypothetical protein